MSFRLSAILEFAWEGLRLSNPIIYWLKQHERMKSNHPQLLVISNILYGLDFRIHRNPVHIYITGISYALREEHNWLLFHTPRIQDYPLVEPWAKQVHIRTQLPQSSTCFFATHICFNVNELISTRERKKRKREKISPQYYLVVGWRQHATFIFQVLDNVAKGLHSIGVARLARFTISTIHLISNKQILTLDKYFK